MKILFYAPEFPPSKGGMQTYIVEIIKLLKVKHEITVLTRSEYNGVDYTYLGVNVLPLLTMNFSEDLKAVLGLITEFDLFHINNAGFSPAIPVIKDKINIPVVVTCHGKDFLQPYIYKKEKLRQRIDAADKIIVVSNYLKQKLIAIGISKKIIEVVYHGTDSNLFKPIKKDDRALKKLSIKKTDFILLTVSRVVRKKNMHGVIKCLPLLNRKFLRFKYVIIGPIFDDEYYEELQELIDSLAVGQDVIFLGPITHEDLPIYYNLCDAYIMPSLEPSLGDIESFGISFLEASACGKPVIGSIDSGAFDVIVDGKTGFLIKPNKKEIETVLVKLLKDEKLRVRLGKEGRQRVVKDFTWKICATRVNNIYNQLLEGTSKQIGYNEYVLGNESFINGANLYYNRCSEILSNTEAKSLSFKEILEKPDKLKIFKSGDSILTNVGPYAYVYHYLRDKYNLKFRIVRDVQTSLWHGYLLQEELCSKFIKDGDVVLFPSEYCRQLFIKLFQHINADNSFVCYPMNLPKVEKLNTDHLTVGWVGRVCYEKGFDQALDAFITASKRMDDLKMVVGGQVEDPRFSPAYVRKRLKRTGIKSENYFHINNGKFIPYKQIMDLYKSMDILLFPSVANMESLGRTVIEASHSNVKVLGANHGAVSEFVPRENLIPVNYFKKRISVMGSHPLGSVNVEELCNGIMNHDKLKTGPNILRRSDLDLISVLGGKQGPRLKKLHKDVEFFINDVTLSQGLDTDIKKAIDVLINSDYRIFSITPERISHRLNYWGYVKV